MVNCLYKWNSLVRSSNY